MSVNGQSFLLDPEKTKEHALTIRKVRWVSPQLPILPSLPLLMAAARSRTALKVLVLRPFIPMAVRNFSLYWRNKMVDWAPVSALRELRELSRILERCARNVFHEKKDALENGIANGDDDYEGPRRNLMTILCESRA